MLFRTDSRSISLWLVVALAAGCGDALEHRGVAVPALSGKVRAVLVPHGGDAPLDRRIRDAQDAVRERVGEAEPLADLGRLFVAKARRSFDTGFYSLAGLCGEAMAEVGGADADAAFLRGVVAQAMHRFAEAEALARTAVEMRGDFQDHGLLGDVLLDRGDLRAAGDAYQQMLDLKPCLQSYVRAGELEWRRGDVDGAGKMFEMARSAGSPRDAEALAWVTCRLGQLRLALGRADNALELAREAQESLADHAPAHRLEGRAHLALGDAAAALPALERAVALDPLPAPQWCLVECLEVLGRDVRAAEIRARLASTGEREDPRTLAQFLLRPRDDAAASPPEIVDRALGLARAELDGRQDALSLDTLAWAHFHSGDHEAADRAARRALATGCPEPRVFLHAGSIARARGDRTRAADLLRRAATMAMALHPSECALLRAERAAL